MITRLLCGLAAGLFLIPAVAQAQPDADTYRRRPFYTYDLYDALDGFDYGRAAGRGPGGSGHYGGTDYLNYYDGDYYHDPDLYGDVVDQTDWGGYDYLGYDDRYNYDAVDVYEDKPDRVYAPHLRDDARPRPRAYDPYGYYSNDPWDYDGAGYGAYSYDPWDYYDDLYP